MILTELLLILSRGDVVLLSNMNLSVPDAPWCLHKIWSHGHTGIVRGLLWDEPVSVFFASMDIVGFIECISRTKRWLLVVRMVN